MKIELVKHANEVSGITYSVEQNGETIEQSKSNDLEKTRDIFNTIVERRKQSLKFGFTTKRVIESIEL